MDIERILPLVLSKKNRVSYRTLRFWMDQNYWDYMIEDQGERFRQTIEKLVDEQYLGYTEFVEPDAQNWWGYYVTDLGIAYLRDHNLHE
ncbi:hypothetical protein SAMN05216327_102201 [Dyadobacter sp. SG02]|uniref:hypothetical protein n=1 Tax=Dyadobacter sp. SG02 TaxID=1855291 RepID=UPI0008C3D560|nr:hypothetical protein [Dyadobacter sp. SG02]SEI52179.1 hypothetical protein SAMN05216327_102201 [Dyadobacter sp. SG02]